MRLKSIELRNFKGIRDLIFEPDGRDAAVYGDNATGKTTRLREPNRSLKSE